MNEIAAKLRTSALKGAGAFIEDARVGWNNRPRWAVVQCFADATLAILAAVGIMFALVPAAYFFPFP